MNIIMLYIVTIILDVYVIFLIYSYCVYTYSKCIPIPHADMRTTCNVIVVTRSRQNERGADESTLHTRLFRSTRASVHTWSLALRSDSMIR